MTLISDTTKEKPTLPSSPLQRMNNPILKRLIPTNPFTRRARGTIRAFILALTLVVLVSVLNELRCEVYGCTSRVSFYSVGNGNMRSGETEDKGGFVGGGAAIGNTWKDESQGKDVGASSFSSSSFTLSPSPSPPPPPPPPFPDSPPPSTDEQDALAFGEGALMSSSSSVQSYGKEAGNGKWVDDEAKEKTLEDEMKKLMKAQTQAYEQNDPAKALITLSSAHAVSRPAPTNPAQATELKAAVDAGKSVDSLISELESMEDHFKKSAAKPGLGSQRAAWQQGEGQEDPVRVTMPPAKNLGNALAVGGQGVSPVEAGSENAMLGSMNMGVFGGR